MKTKLIVLGCGSSIGVPRIDGYWGNCKKSKKNYRTRCSIFIKRGNNNILIDTSPDLKYQLLKNNIKNINSVLYTHDHADQTHGINELRPFFWKNKKKINIYGNFGTINSLKKRFPYCFKKISSYSPFLHSNIVKKKIILGKNSEKISFNCLPVKHGPIKSVGYIFEGVAYLSDCNGFFKNTLNKLLNLKILIIDCLKKDKHPSHFNLDEAIHISKILRPKKTILTNLHHDLDYDFLLNKLPTNVIPAHDGLKINL